MPPKRKTRQTVAVDDSATNVDKKQRCDDDDAKACDDNDEVCISHRNKGQQHEEKSAQMETIDVNKTKVDDKDASTAAAPTADRDDVLTKTASQRRHDVDAAKCHDQATNIPDPVDNDEDLSSRSRKSDDTTSNTEKKQTAQRDDNENTAEQQCRDVAPTTTTHEIVPTVTHPVDPAHPHMFTTIVRTPTSQSIQRVQSQSKQMTLSPMGTHRTTVERHTTSTGGVETITTVMKKNDNGEWVEDNVQDNAE